MFSTVAFANDNTSIATADEYGRIFVWALPPSKKSTLLHMTGERTNYLVCRDSFSIVPVDKSNLRDTIWAPKELCSELRIWVFGYLPSLMDILDDVCTRVFEQTTNRCILFNCP